MKRAADAKQAEIEQMGQSMAALGAKLKKLSAGDKRQPQRAALTARVEREEQAKEKLRKAQAQCKHMQAQLAERTRQLQLHTSGAIENDAASPNVPRGVPRRGLGPGSVEVVKRDGREADVMRRTLEATRVPSLTPSLAPQPVPPPSLPPQPFPPHCASGARGAGEGEAAQGAGAVQAHASAAAHKLHTSGAIENDAASPNVPRGVPRRGLGPGSVEVVKWRRSRYRLHRCRLSRLRLGAHAAIANAPRRYHRNRTAVLG
jgi:hypothetical protein